MSGLDLIVLEDGDGDGNVVVVAETPSLSLCNCSCPNTCPLSVRDGGRLARRISPPLLLLDDGAGSGGGDFISPEGIL